LSVSHSPHPAFALTSIDFLRCRGPTACGGAGEEPSAQAYSRWRRTHRTRYREPRGERQADSSQNQENCFSFQSQQRAIKRTSSVTSVSTPKGSARGWADLLNLAARSLTAHGSGSSLISLAVSLLLASVLAVLGEISTSHIERARAHRSQPPVETFPTFHEANCYVVRPSRPAQRVQLLVGKLVPRLPTCGR
jgi:hypothetical protein